MDSPFGFGGDPEQFADAPLFREMQRVMAASSGPVNWELARQVGIASAQEAGPDTAPSDEDRAVFEESARVAELHVARFTGLEAPSDIAAVRAIRRAEWVTANSESMKGLLEPAANRLSGAMQEAAGGLMPQEMGQAAGFWNQLAPLLLGAQVGTVLGFLGQRVMGQYDVAVPRDGAGELLFVVPNIASFERDWSLDATEFRTYIAFHEVTHRFEFAPAWARARFRSLLDDFLSTMQVDVEGVRDRLARMDASDPEALQSMLGAEEAMFGTVLDDEQRLKLGRVQSFMAAAEGYGDHVMHALGAELLPSYPRIDEAMRRYREGEASDPVFERLLGIEMKREQYVQGRAFCDKVAELTDEATLSRMWASAEEMPSLPEIEEPRLWLARIV